MSVPNLDHSPLAARLARAVGPAPTATRRGDWDFAGNADAPYPTPLTPAAVLIAVVAHDRPTVLFTRRTANLRAHAGQVAFPGGRIDPDDADPVAAALREAHEEIALPPAAVSVIGATDRYTTGTGYDITPVIGIVPRRPRAGARGERGRVDLRGAARLSSSTPPTTSCGRATGRGGRGPIM